MPSAPGPPPPSGPCLCGCTRRPPPLISHTSYTAPSPVAAAPPRPEPWAKAAHAPDSLLGVHWWSHTKCATGYAQGAGCDWVCTLSQSRTAPGTLSQPTPLTLTNIRVRHLPEPRIPLHPHTQPLAVTRIRTLTLSSHPTHSPPLTLTRSRMALKRCWPTRHQLDRRTTRYPFTPHPYDLIPNPHPTPSPLNPNP